LNIFKKNNGFADDDLKRMRTIVNKDLKLEREKIIKRHPWYNDMVNKMIYTTGTARELTETENILLKQIRKYGRKYILYIIFKF